MSRGTFDASAVDEALVEVLAGDATLAGLLPDGVFFDVAPPQARRFCVVSVVTQRGVPVFGGCAIEDTTYLVKAVCAVGGGGSTPIREAAARIDDLLDDGLLPVPAPYAFMACFRDDADGRVRYLEVDDLDKSIRWYHRGARYRVHVSRQ